jgi:hypothetical protein
MRYWELIADGLQHDGWSLGWFSFRRTEDDRSMWSADATKGDGRRIVVRAEDLTVAFLELETQCRRAGLVTDHRRK